MMKTILITGSNGLVGSAVIRKSKYKTIKHTRSECDLANRDQTISYILKQKKQNNIDTIIHCAAEVGGVLKNTMYPEKMFHNNLVINNNIIEAAFNAGIKNFVNILSTCIFPDNAKYPLTTDQIYNGDPHKSAFGYALAKRLSFQTVQYYRKVFKINWINVAPNNIYGINDNFNFENSHVIPALIRKAHNAKMSGEDFVIWGTGKKIYRQFIYSDDLANLILWALDNWKKDEVFMAINPNEYSINQLSLKIAKKFNIKKNKIKYDLSKPDGIARMTAVSDASWYNFISIEEGLSETIEWYMKNLDNIRK